MKRKILESFERDIPDDTLLHFLHPVLGEVAAEILQVFPEEDMKLKFAREAGDRSFHILFSAALVVCYLFF